MNKVILIGRITKDVECKKTTNETKPLEYKEEDIYNYVPNYLRSEING